MTNITCLAFGEILWDVQKDKGTLGGAPFNFAAHFHKLGGDVDILSAIGSDELGKDTIKSAQNLGINTKNLQVLNDFPTGRCLVSLNEAGVPSYNLLDNQAYDNVSFSKEIKQQYDLFYFGSLALRHQNNIDTLNIIFDKCSFQNVLLDINVRKPYCSKEVINFALSKCTILKISDEELPYVCSSLNAKENEFTIEFIASSFKNISLIVLTKGEKGASCLDIKQNKTYEIEAIKTKVASTVGAGDSFAAAFVYSYLNNEKLEKCLTNGTKLSSFVVSQLGAIPDYNPIEIF